MHKKCHSFCGLGVRAVPQVSGTTARTFFGEDPEQSNPSLGLPWRSKDTGEPQEPGQGGAWIFWQLYLSDPHLYFFGWLCALGSSLSAGSFGENHRRMGWETRWRQKDRQVAISGPAQQAAVLLGRQDHALELEKLDISELRAGLPGIKRPFVSGPLYTNTPSMGRSV